MNRQTRQSWWVKKNYFQKFVGYSTTTLHTDWHSSPKLKISVYVHLKMCFIVSTGFYSSLHKGHGTRIFFSHILDGFI